MRRVVAWMMAPRIRVARRFLHWSPCLRRSLPMHAPRARPRSGEVDWGGRRTDNAAWFFGRPRVGQEAFDVLRVAERWRARRDVASISLAASGRWAKAALFAAALDPEIAGLAASLPPTDRAQFEAGGRSALADVPGLLAVGDLPQIVGLVAPRPCALGVPDPGPYAWSRAAYRVFGSDALAISAAKPH